MVSALQRRGRGQHARSAAVCRAARNVRIGRPVVPATQGRGLRLALSLAGDFMTPSCHDPLACIARLPRGHESVTLPHRPHRGGGSGDS